MISFQTQACINLYPSLNQTDHATIFPQTNQLELNQDVTIHKMPCAKSKIYSSQTLLQHKQNQNPGGNLALLLIVLAMSHRTGAAKLRKSRRKRQQQQRQKQGRERRNSGLYDDLLGQYICLHPSCLTSVFSHRRRQGSPDHQASRPA